MSLLAGAGVAQALLVPRSGIQYGWAPGESHVVALAVSLLIVLSPVILGLWLVAKTYRGRVPPLQGAEWLIAASVVGPIGAWAAIGSGHNAFFILFFWGAVQLAFVGGAWASCYRKI